MWLKTVKTRLNRTAIHFVCKMKADHSERWKTSRYGFIIIIVPLYIMKVEAQLPKTIVNFLKEKGYPGLRLRAMLFDMDGVLFDSMKNHTLAWYKAISDVGIACERDFNRKATDEEVENIYAEKSRYFNELPEAGAMPGVKEMLEKVLQRGIIPVLVTGSGQHSLLDRLDREFPGVFTRDRMVTAFDVCHGKPHPEPYLKGLEKAGVQACEAVVVENAILGVQAGVAAGILTVAVNTGPLEEQQLLAAGAAVVFSDMTAWTNYFDKFVDDLSVI